MTEPAKPFACTIQGCGMSFTNEDHLHVHTRKHDMVLQFGMEQKAAFVADQTPTPTRFIRNCEEVGLFQDLQNVNPFDEGFKRAMESKQSILEPASPSSEELHTPQMYPALPTNLSSSQRLVTISRSSSDESGAAGAIKELETTTISKLTNQVTTISRIVEKHEDAPKAEEKTRRDVSYTNNVIKILSNVHIVSGSPHGAATPLGNKDLQGPAPIMSQASIDDVVDNLTADFIHTKEEKKDYEVILKLPSGQQIKLTSAENDKNSKDPAKVSKDPIKYTKDSPKDLLKKVLTDKMEMKNTGPIVIPTVIPITAGTLIPVSVVSGLPVTGGAPKIPLEVIVKRPAKRKSEVITAHRHTGTIVKQTDKYENDKESRKAASKRYREKDKETRQRLLAENLQLRKVNERLREEQAALARAVRAHVDICPTADSLGKYLNDSS